MDRGKEHVVACVEDRLSAIAVVVVHVEDRHLAMALVEKRLGGDGGVVEVAITAHQVAGGVVPRRATQRERTVGAALDRLLCGQRDLGGAVGRLPGAGGNRRAAVEAVVTELAVQAGGQHAAQGAGGPGVGQQVAVLAECGPALPGTFEEVQVVAAMDTLQRREAKVLRGKDRAQPTGFDPLQYVVGARGHFEAGHQLPVHQFTAAVVQVVIVRVDRQHFVVLRRRYRCLQSCGRGAL